MDEKLLKMFEDYKRSGKTTYGIGHNTPDCFGKESEQRPECPVCPFRNGCSCTQNM